MSFQVADTSHALKLGFCAAVACIRGIKKHPLGVVGGRIHKESSFGPACRHWGAEWLSVTTTSGVTPGRKWIYLHSGSR